MGADEGISSAGNPSEQVKRDSIRWLLLGGGFAVGLSYFLFTMDNTLTYSDGEKRLGETLYELRTAQSEVSPGVSDQRQAVKVRGGAQKNIAVSRMEEGAEDSAGH